MRNVSDKIVEKIKTHILCSIFSPRKLCPYEIMWKNTVQTDKLKMTIRSGSLLSFLACPSVRLACCISETTNTISEYVILLAFPQQKWLCERASILRYTYIVCLLFCHDSSGSVFQGIRNEYFSRTEMIF